VTPVAYLANPATGVWDYAVHGLEASLDRAGMARTGTVSSHLPVVLAKSLAKMRLVRNVRQRSGRAYFAPMMGLSEFRLVPVGYVHETIVYAFDCWPPDYDRWESFFRRHRVRLAFFSARASAVFFRGRVSGLEAIWVPEAVDSTVYDPGLDLVNRHRDVLELGRRDPSFHEAVTNTLRARLRSHSFEPQPGAIVFPTRSSLIRGLAETRISVCFPSSMTHPARSGTVETVTHRYFESMAARCLIVGHCPSELSDLFGYNPVIEVEQGRAASQLLEILANIQSYQGLVDRNRERLLEVGTWDARVRAIFAVLRDRGYDALKVPTG
jgi:hypothetical protein